MRTTIAAGFLGECRTELSVEWMKKMTMVLTEFGVTISENLYEQGSQNAETVRG